MPKHDPENYDGSAAVNGTGDLTERAVAVLSRMIGMGELGDPIPPERQIANILGVSRVTIRRAMAVLESKKLVRRIHGQGTFAQLGPPLSTLADLKRGSDPFLLVLVDQEGPRLNIQRTPFTWRICEALRDQLEARGVTIRFLQSETFFSAAFPSHVRANHVFGVFAPTHQWTEEQYADALDGEFPWVGLGRTSHAMYWNIIDLDWSQALRDAIDAVKPTPNDRVFIPNNPYPAEIDQQLWLEVAFDQLAKHRVYASHIVVYSNGPYESNGYLATRWYMRTYGLPTIVLSNFDLSAAGAYRAIRLLHDEKQDPITSGMTRIVGAADLAISQFLSPPLSTLQVSYERIAKCVLDMLAAQRRTGEASMLHHIEAHFVGRGP